MDRAGEKTLPRSSLLGLQAADYKSTNHASHSDPTGKTEAIAFRGRRSVFVEAMIKAQVEGELDVEEKASERARQQGSYDTVSGDSFVMHSVDLYCEAHSKAKESKAKKTLDSPDPFPYRNTSKPAPVAEPHDSEREASFTSRTLEAEKLSAASYDEGDAVTIYSESLQSGENRFPMSGVMAPHAPFGRSSTFTNQIHDGTKKHSEALDVIDEISHAATKERFSAL